MKWIDIKEEFPDKNEKVLVWIGYGAGKPHARIGRVEGKKIWLANISQSLVTHWMRLPDGPGKQR